MHKDQKRIKSAFLPRVMDRVFAETPEAERDCTILNRAFLQGPDPLFLMETCPTEFRDLCGLLALTLEEGRDAIESAHWQGPGVLLEGTGLPPRQIEESDLGDDHRPPLAWRREMLWLCLAALSDTTEEDYKPDVTMLERLRRAMASGQRFAVLMTGVSGTSPVHLALGALHQFEASCVWADDANGVPVCDEDAGFYIGYKRGWKVVGVRHGNKTFFGTTPDTTLEEQGVKVDEKVSESYGFVRHEE